MFGLNARQMICRRKQRGTPLFPNDIISRKSEMSTIGGQINAKIWATSTMKLRVEPVKGGELTAFVVKETLVGPLVAGGLAFLMDIGLSLL